MSDDLTPSGGPPGDERGAGQPTSWTYEDEGGTGRLVRFVDATGRATRYSYDAEGPVVRVWEHDGSMTAFAVPPGFVLARARHPETGAWCQVCLPAPGRAAAESGPRFWPTRVDLAVSAWPALARAVESRPPAPASPIAGRSTFCYDSSGRVAYGIDAAGEFEPPGRRNCDIGPRITTMTYEARRRPAAGEEPPRAGDETPPGQP